MESLIQQFISANVESIEAIPTYATDHSKVYVTLLVNDSFFPGIDALSKSLRSAKARYPLYVLVGPLVSLATETRLQGTCSGVIRVNIISCPYRSSSHEASWSESELTKLNIWNLTQFQRIVYIDADAIVVSNTDELFDLDVPFAASPDIFPPDKFNAGVMVVQPDAAVFSAMIHLVGTIPSHDGGDTGFLNSFFPNWYSGPPQSRLPFGYNAQRTMFWFTHSKQPGYWAAINPLKIIHYSSSPKPWDLSPSKDGLGELEWIWWQVSMGLR